MVYLAHQCIRSLYECGTFAPPLQRVYPKGEYLSLPLIAFLISDFLSFVIGIQSVVCTFISSLFPPLRIDRLKFPDFHSKLS